VTFLNAYIVHWLALPPPPLSIIPLSPLLKQLQKVSLFYFIYVYKVHQSNSPSFILSIHPLSSNPHTPPLDLFYSPVHFLITKSVFTGVSQYSSAVNILYLVSSTPLLLSLTLSFLAPIIQQLPVLIMSSTCTDVMYFDIVDYHSFPFPPPLSSIEYFYYYKLVLYINVCMIMFVFVLLVINLDTLFLCYSLKCMPMLVLWMS
jgi:hypothetical protein